MLYGIYPEDLHSTELTQVSPFKLLWQHLLRVEASGFLLCGVTHLEAVDDLPESHPFRLCFAR
jgi:hypothetical protein